MSNAIVIICSRPESSRLPGKVFRQIAGVPAIQHILNRVRGAGYPVVLAVPPKTSNLYRAYINAETWPIFYEGEANSPLHRMAAVVRDRPEEYVIRITHDDILTDVTTLVGMVEAAENMRAGYVYCPDIVRGADVEVIHRDNLLKAAESRHEPTEFISYFVKDSTSRLVHKFTPRASIKRPYRLTMDYESDGLLLEILFRKLGIMATVDDICAYLDVHPELLKINRLPDVTVYTCVRNGDTFISAAMSSVIPQIHDGEYILVDDYSTDETINQIVRSNIGREIKLILNESHMGLASSSNKALDKSRGKYIMRVDADDILMPHALRALRETMDRTGAVAVYPAYQTIGIPSDDTGDPRVNHHVGGAMMRADVLKEFRFKEGLMHWDSLELYNRLKAKGQIEYIDEPLFFYRKHPESLSMNTTPERKKTLDEIREIRESDFADPMEI